jgi:hypothetical protein
MARARKETAVNKQTPSGRKLGLNRETVRQLDAKALEQIRGGASNDTIVRPSDACGIPTSG